MAYIEPKYKVNCDVKHMNVRARRWGTQKCKDRICFCGGSSLLPSELLTFDHGALKRRAIGFILEKLKAAVRKMSREDNFVTWAV